MYAKRAKSSKREIAKTEISSTHSVYAADTGFPGGLVTTGPNLLTGLILVWRET